MSIKLTDQEIMTSFTTCTRADCCGACKLQGIGNCCVVLDEMVIDLLKRQHAIVKKVERANKVKKQMARNEGKRLLSKKG